MTSPTTHKIVLIDDHPIIRDGMAANISSHDDLEVCSQFDSASTAEDYLRTESPDLVISDLNLGDRSGLDLMKSVRAQGCYSPFLFLSMHSEDVFAERTIRAGARGYMMKSTSAEAVIEAVRTVLAGNIYLSPKLSQNMTESMFQGRGDKCLVDRLTDREIEVLMAIGQGKTTKEIAADLGIGIKTVETHRQRIKTKLGLGDATALTKFAIEFQSDL